MPPGHKQMGHRRSQKRLWERFRAYPTGVAGSASHSRVVACEEYVGGMLDMSGGHIHPLNLALGEAAAVESLGRVIHEQSPAVHRARRPVVVPYASG